MIQKRIVTSCMKSIRCFSTANTGVGDPFKWDPNTHCEDMFDIDSLLSEDERMVKYVFFVYILCIVTEHRRASFARRNCFPV